MAEREYPTWGDPRLSFDMPGLYFDLPLPSYITDPPDLNQKGIRSIMELPKDQDQLESLGYTAAAGALQLQDTIPLKTNRHEDVLIDAHAFRDSRHDVDRLDAVRSRSYDQQDERAVVMREFLMTAKDVLSRTLGRKWSSLWAEAGWNENNLRVPEKVEEAMPILRAQVAYLTAHPEVAMADARYNYTLARANEVLALMDYALNNADDTNGKIIGTKVAEQRFDAAMQTRKLTKAALERRLRGLQGELQQNISPTSGDWLVFGFDQPGAKERPGAITDITAEAIGSGRVTYRWTNAPRATYTQIWLPDAEGTYQRRETVPGEEKTLDGFTPGAVVKARLRPGNETSYGPFSDEITVTVV